MATSWEDAAEGEVSIHKPLKGGFFFVNAQWTSFGTVVGFAIIESRYQMEGTSGAIYEAVARTR